jgi:hypothetical protein
MGARECRKYPGNGKLNAGRPFWCKIDNHKIDNYTRRLFLVARRRSI